MQQQSQSSGQPGFSTILRDIVDSMRRIVQGEIRLARAEVKETAHDIKSQLMKAVFAGVIAMIGVLPMIAFLVIGLGKLLNDNYWLSSLIIGVVFIVFGWFVAIASIRRIGYEDLSFPNVRESLEHERELLNRKLTEFETKRRAS